MNARFIFNHVTRQRALTGLFASALLLAVTPAFAQNQAPSGTSNTVTTPEDTPYTFSPADFGFTDSDSPSNNFLAVKITALPGAGTLTKDGAALSAGTFVSVVRPSAGETWTAQTGSPALDWVCMASSADGTKLVAGGWDTYLYTSTNSGVTWTARMTDKTRCIMGVASSADGSKLVATTRYDSFYTSTDYGVTWTPHMTNLYWLGVASSTDGTKLVAVDGSYIWTTTDSGVNWTRRESLRDWRWVASSADGVKLVATAFNGQIYTSTDSGTNWTPRSISTNWNSVASSADGTKLVAVVYYGQIYTSTDSGTNWTARDSSRNWNGVASSADGKTLVATVNGGQIYTSTDSGANWVPRTGNDNWRGVAMSADGFLMAAGRGNVPYAAYNICTSIGLAPVLACTPASNANGSPYTSFTFQVQDDGGTANGGVDLDPVPKTMTINVTPVNDAPSDIFLSGASVPENQPIGTIVGVLSDLDVDIGDTATFALVSGTGSGDNASFSISNGINLVTAAMFDYATRNSYSIRLRVTDSGGLTFEKQFTISVGNVNAAPAGTANTVTTLEDTPYIFSLADFGFIDLDSPTNNFLAVKITTLPAAGTLSSDGVAVTAGQMVSVAPSTNWTPRESNRYWYSVASSADGTRLVAVEYGGQIYTSTDSGTNWTPRESNRYWYSVASSADGTKLVAAANNDQIYTSTDSGTNWTPRESNRYWYGVASSADGTELVAVVRGGQIYTSTDSGANWTPRASNLNWYSVASSADGTKLIAIDTGARGRGSIHTSTDSGTNWTVNGSPHFWRAVASSADGTKLVAVENGGQIYTSTDCGTNWTAHESNRQWYSVASSADGTRLVAAASGGQIYTSMDSGMSWRARESSRQWYSVASSADGSKLVAVAYSGQIYTVQDTPFLVFTPASDANGTPYTSFTFQVQDDGGTANGGVDLDPVPKTMTINVTPVPDAPSDIFLSSTSVPENQAIGAIVGVLSDTDVDIGDTASFALVSGTGSDDNASFSISNDTNLVTAAMFDYETRNSYSIRVRVTDWEGLTLEKQFTISVSNVIEPPAGTANAVTTLEDTPYTFSTADFGFTDSDSPSNNFVAVLITTLPTAGTLSVDGVDVTEGQTVQVGGSVGTMVFTPDPDANGSPYSSFTFQVQDDGGTANGRVDLDAVPKTMTINVTPVNDAPRDIGLTRGLVVEHQPIGTFVGVLSATDPDAGDTASFALVSGDGDSDNASFSLSDGTNVVTTAVFDCAIRNSYSIRVRATDSTDLSYEKQLTIGITPPGRLIESGLTSPDGAFRFLVLGNNGGAYEVESSTNLKNWDKIGEIALPLGSDYFVAPGAATDQMRFYRLKKK